MEQDLRQSKVELYVHLVWTTINRQECLKADFERAIYRCLEGQARELGSNVLAIGGMPDHLHMVLRIPSKLSVAKLVQQLKGVSSRFARDQLPGGASFAWQAGYGAFSLSRSHLEAVIRYVENQRQHHTSGKVWPEWEETDEAAPSRGPNEAEAGHDA